MVSDGFPESDLLCGNATLYTYAQDGLPNVARVRQASIAGIALGDFFVFSGGGASVGNIPRHHRH